jgi:hypothetical protein
MFYSDFIKIFINEKSFYNLLDEQNSIMIFVIDDKQKCSTN